MKIATYLRVSTSEQDVAAQRLELSSYCQRQGWESSGEFSDVMSGAKADRPGLEALLATCEVGEIQAVVVVKLDRLGRSLLNVLQVIEGLGATIEEKLVVSLAAGIRVASMEEKSQARFMRVMTNTPAAVCQAATALARGGRTTDEDFARVREIFSAIGFVAEVEENQIDAVTALAGSGPAFVYTVIEALAAGGAGPVKGGGA